MFKLTCLQRPSEVRHQLEQSHMQVDQAPDDDDVRQSYNFAPGYHGLVYRADGPDFGSTRSGDQQEQEKGKLDDSTSMEAAGHSDKIKYKLQAMKWGKLDGMHFTVERHADPISSPRPCTVLDQAQPGLRFHDEDDQLPGRLIVRGSRYVDEHEEEEAVHRGRTGLLRMAQEEQREGEDTSFHQAQGQSADVFRWLIRQCPV